MDAEEVEGVEEEAGNTDPVPDTQEIVPEKEMEALVSS